MIAWVIGWLWWTLVPIRKRLAIANLQAALPDVPPGPTLRRAVGGLVAGYVELLSGRQARVVGAEQITGGALCLAGHGEAFDVAITSAAAHLPVTIFVRTPANRMAAWVVERLRRRSGLELLPPRGSMDRAYDAVRRGRVVVFVQDQRHNTGLAVPFFGRPALTSAAFGAMAWRTRAPLFGGWPTRDPDGRLRVTIEPLGVAIPEDRDEAIAALTEASQRFYEDRIRAAPHGWLWLHDRWRGGS